MKSAVDKVNPDAVKDALVSGSFAAVLSAAALSVCSQQEEGSVAGEDEELPAPHTETSLH